MKIDREAIHDFHEGANRIAEKFEKINLKNKNFRKNLKIWCKDEVDLPKNTITIEEIEKIR